MCICTTGASSVTLKHSYDGRPRCAPPMGGLYLFICVAVRSRRERERERAEMHFVCIKLIGYYTLDQGKYSMLL